VIVFAATGIVSAADSGDGLDSAPVAEDL